MKKIGFIGVGIMGKSMVRNLKKAGFDLHIYARTKAKVEDVIAEGVTFHDSIADCVKDCEAVITIVGFPQDVEEVYFDQGNILDSAKEGAVLKDTLISEVKKFIKDYGKKKGYDYIYGTGDAATVLYAKEGYDITKEVLKELNDTYKATKKDDKVATKEDEKK
jgi:3-hydroxyisobutyrate dehydrogenase-like beta-hydroxyacid dehydrogenase